MDDLRTRFTELDSIEPPAFVPGTHGLPGAHEPPRRRIAALTAAAVISAASLIILVRAFESSAPAPAAPVGQASPFVQLIQEIRAADAQLEPTLMSLSEQIGALLVEDNGANASEMLEIRELMQQRQAACRDGMLYPTLRSLHSIYVIDFCSSEMHDPSDGFPATLGVQSAQSRPEGCQDFFETAPSSGYCLDAFVVTGEESRVLREVLSGHTVVAESVDALLGSTPPKGYPSVPGSGYWMLFPDAPQPMADGPDGAVRIVALTNLPDGTMFLTNTERGGMCCSAVKDGQMVVQESSTACHLQAGGHKTGTSITITVSADMGEQVFGVPVGGQPPHQPQSVLATLGAHFENLTGEQVVENGGERVLVASARYSWREPLCLEQQL